MLTAVQLMSRFEIHNNECGKNAENYGKFQTSLCRNHRQHLRTIFNIKINFLLIFLIGISAGQKNKLYTRIFVKIKKDSAILFCDSKCILSQIHVQLLATPIPPNCILDRTHCYLLFCCHYNYTTQNQYCLRLICFLSVVQWSLPRKIIKGRRP